MDLQNKLTWRDQEIKELKHELTQINLKHRSEIDRLNKAYDRILKEKEELHAIVKDRDFELLKIHNGKIYLHCSCYDFKYSLTVR